MKLSVIIPTFNRAKLLSETLVSILNQSLDSDSYEILLIDNNSNDETLEVVKQLNSDHNNRIKYIFEEAPGLVNGRHRGAKESQGDILVFADDDIIASHNWLAAIQESFADPRIGLVGGKVLPQFEIEPPSWLDAFWGRNELGKWNIYLSLIDLGEEIKEIPANFVFGCNYAIRKNVLYQCGGFHPDSFPIDLIKYRGDGEAGLGDEIMKQGYQTLYNPQNLILHKVTKNRLTPTYFCRRAFFEGISNSYTEIRRQGKLLQSKTDNINFQEEFVYGLLKGIIKVDASSLEDIQKMVNLSYQQGKLYHQKEVKKDTNLLSSILKNNYFEHGLICQDFIDTMPEISPQYYYYNNKNVLEILNEQVNSALNEAQKLLGECRYSEAINKLDEVMYLAPNLKGLQYLRAKSLLSIGKVAEAETAAKSELLL